MSELIRGDVSEDNAYSGYVVAGDTVYLSFCVGNVGESVERQVEGALDGMERRRGVTKPGSQAGVSRAALVTLSQISASRWVIASFRRRGYGSSRVSASGTEREKGISPR